MIDLQVRGETGTIDARAKHGVVRGPEPADLDQSAFPMPGHLLPYADTVFDHRQVATLSADRAATSCSGRTSSANRPVSRSSLVAPGRRAEPQSLMDPRTAPHRRSVDRTAT